MRRRLLGALISIGVLGASVAVVVAVSGAGSPSRTPDDGVGAVASASGGTASASTVARTRDLRFGLAFGDTLMWMTDAERAKALDDAEELGVKWLRVDLSWRNIQPDYSTQYLWERFDRVVDAAGARGLEVLPTISYTPRWAADPNCGSTSQTCPPADNAQFAEFARQAAARYAPKGVHTWEIWNEPNIKPFWQTGPDAERYANLLAKTAKAVRSADSKAYLLLGGLAAVDTIPSKQYVSHKTFLAELGRLGALKQVDAISYHPYTYPLLPSTESASGTTFQDIDRSHDNLVSILKRYGKPKMPIWLTETGAPTWSTGKPADSEDAKGTAHVTPRFQAEIATDTVQASAAIPSVDVVFWFSYQDGEPETAESRKARHYGLTYYDGRRKPSFEALEKAIQDYKDKN
ncbi:cellulase family glycosylhydrolase [Streptomyces fulvoviolaceus]|uniref:cellulase family glycosylhydrolase n=1 Tax=Streptomyces fulvoviolaceus TaxID=285535 RepID=UPI0021BE489D|nr:cellulase family glycosylhydrolase [Streptomyces fulvoviolaceus]MCT9082299.1 cellulase family glycosylhydrolase [Streptomyces fulvoviolaceus]